MVEAVVMVVVVVMVVRVVVVVLVVGLYWLSGCQVFKVV